MYTPRPNEETRVEVLHGLVRAHPVGTWTLFDGEDLLTNHVPFDLDGARGPFGTLVGHVARMSFARSHLRWSKRTAVHGSGP